LPKVWTYQNSFKYENDDLKAIFADVYAGNTGLTNEMIDFNPIGKFLFRVLLKI
jgi:hypothetical protein